MNSKHEVEVLSLPSCDVPGCPNKAGYDCKTKMGPWANLCEEHFGKLSIGLGLGKGQKLVLAGTCEEPKEELPPVKKESAARYDVRIIYEFIESVDGLDLEELSRRANIVLKKFKPKSKEITLKSSRYSVEKIEEKK